jgi:hypothetical protein
VLLGVGDHLVERQDEVAGALGEAASHCEVAHPRADVGDLRRIVAERRAVALLLLHPRSSSPDAGHPPDGSDVDPGE